MKSSIAPATTMLFVFVGVALAAPAVPVPAPGGRTALAVIHEPGGAWGSVVFTQAARTAPVFVTASLHSVDVTAGPVHWGLHEAPVHYETAHPARCGLAALGPSVRIASSGPAAGDLSETLGPITSKKFAAVGYAKELSLYEDEPGFVAQRALALGAPGRAAACATVYMVRMAAVQAGAVPCEAVRYADCAMAVSKGRCIKKECTGFRQFWGITDVKTSAIDANTQFCTRVAETAPTKMGEVVARDGSVECDLGPSEGLQPIRR